MTPLKVSALFMFVGFVLLVAGGIFAPPGVYRESNVEDQLKIIEDHSS